MPELRPYQREDVEFIKQRKTVGVFNEQRTGKTPTVCVALKEMGISHYVVVCPNSLLYMWKAAIKTWADIDAIVYTNPSCVQSWKESNVPIIINYEQLRGNKNKQNELVKYLQRRKIEAVVLDEAHTIRNRKNLTCRVCNMLGRRTEIRIAITGTPAYNTPQDVWAIANWISPGYLGTYYDFCRTFFKMDKIFLYGRVIEKETVNYIPGRDRILAGMLSKISVQRKRKDVMDWCLDIEPTVIKLQGSPEQMHAINCFEKFFEYKDVQTINLLDNMQKIRQVCADMRLIGHTGTSPKTDWCVSFINDNPDKSVIIFSLSTKYINLLTKVLKEHNIDNATITGDTDTKEREQLVEDFQNTKIKVLLIQALCGKEGLTLDQADVAIFLDNYPPAGIYNQAKDRLIATNPDRVKPQELIHVMIQNTYDERLFYLVAHNVKETEVINDYHKYIRREV